MSMLFGVHRSCLRPCRKSFRPFVEVVEDRLLLTTFRVTNNADSGFGSLRQAIIDANGDQGAGRIEFHITTTGLTISPNTPLPIITAPVVIDGYTQPGASPNTLDVGDNAVLNIVLSGSGVNPQSQAAGLDIKAQNVTVQGLVINEFYRGILIENGFNNSHIQGNFIGTDAAGKNALGNAFNGVDVHGDNNTIGGTTSGARNVISGNLGNGVAFNGGPNNVVEGNYIGTNAAGKNALGNTFNGVGVFAAGNTIGGAAPGVGNVISGNKADGVFVDGPNTVVQGNYIGTDATGTNALGNVNNGVDIQADNNTKTNTIGGTTSEARNVISGNGMQGIFINVAGSNQVQGNYIGTTANGTGRLDNGLSGINLNSSSNNTIGGSSLAARNIISGNKSEGVTIASGSNNVVEGNYIGTDVTGTMALGNTSNGVDIEGVGAIDNTIGGMAEGERNVISGNNGFGVLIGSPNTFVQGNYIGTDFSGQTALGNTQTEGVVLLSGANGSTIGGTADGARNVISGNQNNGVLILGSNTVVQGNYIGTDATGKNLLFNFGNGVLIVVGANGNTIGGTAPGARNVISGNLNNGINIRGSNNVVQGNFIGPDVSGQTALAGVGNFGNGVLILSGGAGSKTSNNTIGGMAPGAGNVISGNQGNGVNILGLNTVVQGNRIGTDFTGQTAVANLGNGVFILSGADGSTIGGTADGARNVISGNIGDGVASDAKNTVVQGNYIGTDVSGDAKLSNLGFGVRITSGSGDLIGGTSPGSLNVIAGNFGGINVIQVTNSTIQGNRIGIGKSDNALTLGNRGIGVLITSSTGITIGGTTDAARNFIVNNSTGVTLVDSSSNPILGNTINNNGTGVSITGGGGDPILGNLIQDNDGIGITIISADDNTIGGTASGAGNLIKGNNTGVSITKGNRNSIFGNSITVNMGIGVAIASGNSNPILNNTISENGLGIDLGPPGPTLNDSSGHADANHLQNFPILNSITTSPDGTSTRIFGQLNSTPNTTFTIQLFEDVQYPSGFGQGMIFDEVRVTTDAKTGIATIDVTVPMAIAKGPFPFVSATATNLTTADTSEFSPQITEISYTVTTVADNGNDSTPTPGSLRAAILNAIANVTAIQGFRTIDFKIPGQGPFTIAPPTPLPRITAPVNIDGTTQAGYDPNHPTPMIELTGRLITPPNVNGLTISSGKSTVKGLVIDSFTGAGIALITNGGNTNGGNMIAGNYLGTDVTGTMPLPNGFGVTIIDVSNNTIGGTIDADRNLISGNGFDGVLIDTSQGMAADNVVEGNYIGTDVTGTVALANALAGVAITASTIPATNNTIGGTTPAARNVIAGNSQSNGSGVGVQILGAGATGNFIEGNFIGLDVSGTRPLRNDTGVLINGAADNTIGGLTTRAGSGPGNVISSYVPSNSTNTGVGVEITGPGAMRNIVEGNLIGTDASGTRTLVADQAGLGILISNTPGSNTVGGVSAMARNIIAGFKTGIEIFAPQSPFNSPTGSTIAGNYIGTDVTGEVPLRNQVGVYINVAPNNMIGGPTALPGTGLGNVISGNLIGIYLLASTTTGNQIQGNLIGLDAAGKAPLGNYIGIYLDAASGNTIGGATASTRNVIAGDRTNLLDHSTGIYFFDNAANNVVENNFIGTNVNGNRGKGLGQGDYGVLLYNAPNNTVVVAGKNANRILGSGIAAIREFTGSTPPIQSAGSGSGTGASGGTKHRPHRLSSSPRRQLRASRSGGGSRGQAH